MKWFITGFLLIIIGMLIIFGGFFYSIYKSNYEKEVKGGGIIMIGPFPIIFGSDTDSLKFVSILAIILMVISIILNLLHN
ncbi:MAG TPA: DUF131 domain-containing protein [Halobacteria archaeon]|jgi:uncharacterized protein (TIGR00304 family)|nr:DUF131 domain-containing protein [Halobacteria archaeon]